MAIKLGDVFVALGWKGRKEFSDQMNQTGRQVRSWADGIKDSLGQSLNFAVGGFIQQGLNAIAGAIQATGRTAFEAVASNERLQLSLESLIASQLKAGDATLDMSTALQAAAPLARDLYQWVVKLAAQSPFDEEGASQALQTALGFRFTTERSKELIQALTDQAAAAGRSTESVQRATVALGQMNAKGKVSAEELNQLREAGVDANRALDLMGVTLDDVAKGTVNTDQFIDALLTTLEDVEGAAARQATSWAGLLTTFDGLVRTGLRTFFEGILQPLQPLAAQLTDLLSNKDLLEGARQLGAAIGDILGGGIEFLKSQLEGLPSLFSGFASFIRQLRDEIAGLSPGDILAQLAPGLANIQQQAQVTLETMLKAHQGTIKQLEEDINAAGERIGEAMAKVAEKYGPKIKDLEGKLAEARIGFDERITDQAEQHAKRRAGLEEQIIRSQAALEEKLTELKTEHNRKRRQLSQSLLLAESEEQYLAIQEQIRAEDERFNEQSGKAKEANKEQTNDLKKRLDEEQKEFEKQEARLQRDRGKALGDIQEQLAEIRGERAKEEAEVKALYNAEVDALANKIEREKELFQQQITEQRASFEQQAADFEASIKARAEARGQGPAAQVGEWIRTAQAALGELAATVGTFIAEHGEPLLAILAGIGVTLVAGGVLAALALLASAISAIGVPTLALAAAVGILSVAWVEDWGGIQSKTAEVLEWLQTNISAALEAITDWWEEHGESIRQIVDAFLGAIQWYWDQHGQAILNIISLLWNNLATIFQEGADILGGIIDLLAGIVTGDWQKVSDSVVEIVSSLWNIVTGQFETAKGILLEIVMSTVNGITDLFIGKDWKEIGQSILDGIGEGISGFKDDLVEKSSDALRNLLGKTRNFLQARSPSQLFAEQVGRPIAEGIGEGFKAGTEGLSNAIQSALQPGQLAGAGAVAGPGPATLPDLSGLGQGGDHRVFAPNVSLTVTTDGSAKAGEVAAITADRIKAAFAELIKQFYEGE